MHCITCNTPSAPHEIIEGLCHRCTATALKAALDDGAEFRRCHAEFSKGLKDALGIRNGPVHTGPFREFIAAEVRRVVGERDAVSMMAVGICDSADALVREFVLNSQWNISHAKQVAEGGAK